jgi:DNA helicase INO80
MASAPMLDQAGPDTSRRAASNHYDPTQERRVHSDDIMGNGILPAKNLPQAPPPLKPRVVSSEQLRESVAKALERLEDLDKSDVEAPGFEHEWHQYANKNKKRARDLEHQESQKRKVS